MVRKNSPFVQWITVMKAVLIGEGCTLHQEFSMLVVVQNPFFNHFSRTSHMDLYLDSHSKSYTPQFLRAPLRSGLMGLYYKKILKIKSQVVQGEHLGILLEGLKCIIIKLLHDRCCTKIIHKIAIQWMQYWKQDFILSSI